MMSSLTPEEKRKIYEEEKVKIEAREKIQKDKKAQQQKNVGIGCLVFLIIAAVIYIIGELGPKKSRTTQPEQPQARSKEISQKPSSDLLSQAVKDYLGCAGGYLKSTNEVDGELAETMAGASNGSSTLDDIKSAVNRAISVGDAAWYGDYQKSPVPPEYQNLHAKIEKFRNLRQAGLQEILRYWKDDETNHIISGTDEWKRAINLQNECIADLNKIMRSKMK
jgi:hypothetical protein